MVCQHNDCQRCVETDGWLCALHRPIFKKQNADVVSRVEDDLYSGKQNRLVFEDLKINSLELSELKIDPDNNHEIVFKNTTFFGSVILTRCILRSPLRFENCTILGGLEVYSSTFRQDVTIEQGQLSHLDLINCKLRCPVGLEEPTITGEFRMSDTTVVGPVDINGDFEELVAISKSSIQKQISLENCSFYEGLLCKSLTARSDFSVSNVRLDASQLDWENTEREENTERYLVNGMHFEGCQLESLRINNITTTEVPTALFSFRESEIETGKIQNIKKDNLYIDFTDAELGNLNLEAKTGSLITNLRICRTIFASFDFDGHRDSFTEDVEKLFKFPNIANIESGIFAEHEYEIPSLPAQELTYLRAKNGAEYVGETTTAAEFAIQEMKTRRKILSNKSEFESTKARFNNKLSRLTNWGFEKTCGYGERFGRLVKVSFYIIVGLGILYPLFDVRSNGSDLNYTKPVLVDGFDIYATLQYMLTLIFEVSNGIYFSAVTFTTLGYGDYQPFGFARIIAGAESFAGAILTALFVFTLGKRAGR